MARRARRPGGIASWTRRARSTSDPVKLVEIDGLAGHIAARRGPVMLGYAILTDGG